MQLNQILLVSFSFNHSMPQDWIIIVPLNTLIDITLTTLNWFPGAILSQTPLGLAAYILEKFSGWTRRDWISLKDGGLSNWNIDELLDNLMIYWVSNSLTSSMRFYAEALNPSKPKYNMDRYI